MLLRSNAYRLALLQQFPGAAAAYSLRGLSVPHILGKLPVVRVRRSSDNDERDFVWWEITDGTLTTWTGAGDGFVRTWYEQSGNARHAEQATAGNQPQIVSSGTLVVNDEGKPSVLFVGANAHRLMTSGGLGAQPYTIFAVASAETSNAFLLDSNKTNDLSLWRSTSGSDLRLYSVNAGISVSGFTLSKTLLIYALANGATSGVALNGGSATTGSIGAGSLARVQIGGNALRWDGFVNEMVIYNADNSANRPAIEANINAAWEIY